MSEEQPNVESADNNPDSREEESLETESLAQNENRNDHLEEEQRRESEEVIIASPERRSIVPNTPLRQAPVLREPFHSPTVEGTPLRPTQQRHQSQASTTTPAPSDQFVAETPDRKRRRNLMAPPPSSSNTLPSIASTPIPATPVQHSNTKDFESLNLTPLSGLSHTTPISTHRQRQRVKVNLLPRSERREPQLSVIDNEMEEDMDAKADMEIESQGPPQNMNIPIVSATEEDEDNSTDEAVIWGTDVHVPTATRIFRLFLRSFISLQNSDKQQRETEKEKREMEGMGSDNDDSTVSSHSTTSGTPFYLQRLIDLSQGIVEPSPLFSTGIPTKNSLELDCRHLYFHSPACQRLYHQLVKYPQEMVPLMDLIVGQEYSRILQSPQEEEEEESLQIPLQIRPHHLQSVSNMRSLDPLHMDSLICLKGMVVRTSPIIPDLKIAFFSCSVCGHTQNVTIDRGKIAEPSGRCPDCQALNSFSLVHNRSTFADKQMVRLQETPDEVPAGETPASIVLFAYDDLVDAVRPGDRVEVTGVFRAMPRRVHPKISKVKSVYKTYIDVIHFKRIGKEQGGEGRGIRGKRSGGMIGATLDDDRIKEVKALSKDPNIYQKLTQSLAPSIWELDNVKKGVLCMLFGGNSRRIKKGSYQKQQSNDDMDSINSEDEDDETTNGPPQSRKLLKRGDINILLCGDPGTSKSQLLSYVHKLAPRGVYTSGKGSSAVGLTASVVRDPETRELVLESGALVLSDLGICCIDEFDKMADTTRAILHEAMEQQTVSIAKAGIIATLNARTSILASANPVESRYNPRKSVVENIQLPPTLLSRFDLIYLILDQPNVDSDRRLAKHLVGLYYEEPDVVEPPLSHDLLRDYILYAREMIHPELSDLASQELIRSYLDMRRSGNGSSRTISATPRQLESLIRLSEALAKIRYSHTVDRRDVKEAVRLMRVATQAAATDPRTGRIDMDMITTGTSQVERDARDALAVAVKELLAEVRLLSIFQFLYPHHDLTTFHFCFTQRRGNRMAVSDVRKQIMEITNMEFSHEEMLENLRSMESDGVIQFNERAQTVFVKTKVSNS